MRMRQTPLTWRRAWQLHRSISSTDSRGDPIRTYNMDTPDYVGAAGASSGVCWQIASAEDTGADLRRTADWHGLLRLVRRYCGDCTL